MSDIPRDAIETYSLKRVWAIFSGCEGDDPQLFGMFFEESVADMVADLTDGDGDPVVFDPVVVPGVIIGGELHVANHYKVTTHDELETVLKKYHVGEPACWHCGDVLLVDDEPLRCEKCPAEGDCDREGCKEPGCADG